MTRAGEDESQLGPFASHDCEGLEEPLVVFVRPAVGRVEEKRLALGVARPEARVVDAAVDGAHALGIESQPLDQGPPGKLADGDHDPAPTHRPAIDELPIGELGPGKELRIGLVLDVVNGRRCGRAADRRQHHAEWEVNRVQPLEVPPKGPRAKGGERHRRDPRRHRAARPVFRHRRRRQPVGRVGGDRRHEHAIVELPDPAERATELSGIGLGPADDAWNEREQADSDGHWRL